MTPVASAPRQLPFESQVDAFRTADPAWPHVHVEVIDPSIPNVPNPAAEAAEQAAAGAPILDPAAEVAVRPARR